MKSIKEKGGITLIALAVTIVVILILSAVTITFVLGEDGIINKAKEAANAMNNAIANDQKELDNLLNELNNVMSGTGEQEKLEGIITFGETIWENGSAKINISTDSTLYELQYQKNGTEGKWTTIKSGEEILGLKHNDTIYARLFYNNLTSENKFKRIEDIEKPTVNVTVGAITINSIAITVEATDAQSGLAESEIYEYYIDNISQTVLNEQTYNYTGLNGNTDYNIKVLVKDKAGNLGEGTAVAKTNIAEPTGWELIGTYTSTGSFTIPKTGYYKVECAAKCGAGGKEIVEKWVDSDRKCFYTGCSGGSGGVGGYAESKLNKQKGQVISFTFSGGNIKCEGINVTAGGDGGTGKYENKGGSAGSASGGNLTNVQGKTGNSGESKIDKHNLAYIVNISGGEAVYGVAGMASGCGAGIIDSTAVMGYLDWTSSPAGSGTNAWVKIYKGNTN